MTVDRNQLQGLEFDFALADEDGHVALFSTAGYGPVPRSALAAEDPAALPEPEAVLLSALHEIGSARLEGRGSGDCAEWPALGRRGVFVYDWRPNGGPYERVIVPEVAITREALAGSVASLISGVIAGCFSSRSSVQSPELGG